MKKLFIFDVDGTLVEAYRAIRQSLNHALVELGYKKEVSLETVKYSVGRGDVLFIKKFFKLAEREKALEIYRKHHKKSLLKLVKAAPLARQTLYSLKRKKKLIAVASNRPTQFTEIILKQTGLKKHLDYVLCADKLEKLKPDPAILFRLMEKFKVRREETVFIGDMDIDMLTAKKAGVEKVFIKGGSTPLSALKKDYGKIRVIASLKEVVEVYG